MNRYTCIVVNISVRALVEGFTNKIVLHRVTVSRERFTLLVLRCTSIRGYVHFRPLAMEWNFSINFPQLTPIYLIKNSCSRVITMQFTRLFVIV